MAAGTNDNERDLQSKKAHLLLGRSARSRYMYDTAGGVHQKVEETLAESYFFWQVRKYGAQVWSTHTVSKTWVVCEEQV